MESNKIGTNGPVKDLKLLATTSNGETIELAAGADLEWDADQRKWTDRMGRTYVTLKFQYTVSDDN